MNCILEDNDRFLLFMALLDSTVEKPATAEELVKYFARMTGWDHNRALSAFEVCVVKGLVDRTGGA